MCALEGNRHTYEKHLILFRKNVIRAFRCQHCKDLVSFKQKLLLILMVILSGEKVFPIRPWLKIKCHSLLLWQWWWWSLCWHIRASSRSPQIVNDNPSIECLPPDFITDTQSSLILNNKVVAISHNKHNRSHGSGPRLWVHCCYMVPKCVCLLQKGDGEQLCDSVP